MAEFRPKNQGLERVLGTGALFATAYGNVGSSIYYALGLVAIYAAGMTPVVFVIAGLIFAATAATYAEATTMYPEAGGSSSFARRAFNEFWSFFAAWGQMLNYIITIAISAFFVPHYLGVFWDAARPLARGHHRRHRRGGRARRGEHRRRQGVGGREHRLRDRRLRDPGAARDRGLLPGARPGAAGRHVDFGTTPTVGNFLIAIPVAWWPTRASRRSRTWPRRRATTARRSRAAIGLVVGAVAVIYAFLPAVALSAMPVKDGTTLLALPKEQGGYADDPVLGVVENMHLGGAAAPGRDLRRAAGGHDPVHRHERGDPRRLAADLLDGPAPAASRAAAGAPPEVPHAVHRDHVFGLIACVAIIPGQADFLGVIYAFGAMLSFTIAHVSVIKLRMTQPGPRAAVPLAARRAFRGQEVPLLAVFGGIGTGLALVVVTVLDLRVLVSGLAWLAIGILLYVVYRRHQGLSLTETHKIVTPKPGRRARGRVRVDPRRVRGRRLLARGGGHGGQAGGHAGGAASTCW